MRFSISLLFKYLSMKITLQIDSKFQLFQMKNSIFPNEVWFEICPALFYENSHTYFQQLNSI